MSEISEHVGHRIKKFRKSRGLTIQQFSQMINKSKATLSKYENGSITIDIDTLLDIAEALEIELVSLIDYQCSNVKAEALPKNIFFNQHKYYMYYYDGRIKKIVRSLILLTPTLEHTRYLTAKIYTGLETFDNVEKCQHMFAGSMKPYDTITHLYLTNQINTTEKLYICILNPMHASSPAIGLIAGIGSNPFFAPVAIKTLISKEMLEENEHLLHVLKLDKEDHHMFKYYNMMVINRQNSLFMDVKK